MDILFDFISVRTFWKILLFIHFTLAVSLLGAVTLQAVAVLMPVAPAAACRTQLPSMDWPAELGGGHVALSKPSVMPAGDVHVAEDEKVCAVTSTVFATVVLTLGVGCVSADGVVAPFSTSIGLAVSTPEKLWMPATALVDPESVQEYEPGSTAPATLR